MFHPVKWRRKEIAANLVCESDDFQNASMGEK